MWSLRDYIMRSGHAYVEIGSNITAINNLVKPSNPTRYAALNMPEALNAVAGEGRRVRPRPGAHRPGRDAPEGEPDRWAVRRVRREERDPRRLLRTGPHHPPVHAGRPSRLPHGRRAPRSTTATSRRAWPTGPRKSSSSTACRSRTSRPARSRCRSSISPARWRSRTTSTGVGSSGGPTATRRKDKYRIYEVAGMGHGLSQSSNVCAAGQQPSQFTAQYVSNNALDKLIQWVDKGTVPPPGQSIATTAPGGPLVTDAYGNAKGGVRSYQVDVPVATTTPASTCAPGRCRSRRRRSSRSIATRASTSRR